MATKATYKGTCQVCGRTQKLPNGVIAKHGYTVQSWANGGGSFMGTCKGSGKLPLEQSCDQIAHFIDQIRDTIEIERTKIEMVQGGALVGISVYGGRYYFEQVVFNRGMYGYYAGDYIETLHMKEGQTLPERCIEKSKWAIQAAQSLINKYEQTIIELQTKIDTWKPQPLKSIRSY